MDFALSEEQSAIFDMAHAIGFPLPGIGCDPFLPEGVGHVEDGGLFL